MDDRYGRVRKVGDQDNEVAPSPRFVDIPGSRSGDPKDEYRREPDKPVRLELLRAALEFVMSEMPLQVNKPARDLASKADQQGPKYPAATHIDIRQATLQPLLEIRYLS